MGMSAICDSIFIVGTECLHYTSVYSFSVSSDSNLLSESFVFNLYFCENIL